ncbi:MAG: nucleoside deaminase [Bryobacterales bacterium]|nr:nucleoside deaminase [Bryobacterales bacterium]
MQEDHHRFGTCALPTFHEHSRSHPYNQVVQHRFLHRAIELAATNARSSAGGPFGAVIVKDGEVIGEGVNQVTAINDPTAHAEVLAIREACRKLGVYQLPGCELYTSCEPCPMCLGAIYWAHIDRVYFAATQQQAAAAGFDDAFIYEQIPLAPEQRSIPMAHVELPEAMAPFNEWKGNPRRTPY